jgi:hypothetical protein
MPRTFMQWLELHAAPPPVPEFSWQEILSFWKGSRVAVVRQAAYRGAYPAGPRQPWEKTVLSAFTHLGPFSFLADLGADYLVVRQTPDPETFRWRDKFLNDPHPNVAFEGVEIWQREQEKTGGLLNCGEIPWETYDFVVTLDVAVPTRIIRKTRKPIWAYYSVEAGGALQKDSLRCPVPGYRLFLNHCFRRFRSRPLNRPHVVEFPFSFQSASAWERLARGLGREGSRTDVVTDKPTWSSISHLHSFPNWRPCAGDAPEYVKLMSSRKYAVRTDPLPRWGNWSIEAVQAGCLFLGNPDSLAMPALLLPGLVVRNPQEAVEVVQRLEKNPDLFDSARHAQSLLAEHLAFRRPLAELTAKFRKILKP